MHSEKQHLTWDVIEGDCLQVISGMEDESIDAIVTDPPYCSGAISESQRARIKGQGLRSGNLRKFGWFIGDNMGTSGLVWLLRSVACEARRVLKGTGSFLFFCDWRMLTSLQPAIESSGLRFQNLLVWDKGSMGLGSGFRCQHEIVLHFTNGSPEYHDFGTANVLHCSRISSEDRLHQTQKPIDLLTKIVRVVTPIGGLVLDPFCGSSSVGISCVQNGYRFVGIEHDPKYVEISRDRLRACMSLFPQSHDFSEQQHLSFADD